ncbi:hypothetical protein BD408DRAFT_415165 [Parasitella parasitica]|nr:hypothetical protein BD408DRAFT_415165 [Parasitella parasitica]
MIPCHYLQLIYLSSNCLISSLPDTRHIVVNMNELQIIQEHSTKMAIISIGIMTPRGTDPTVTFVAYTVS